MMSFWQRLLQLIFGRRRVESGPPRRADPLPPTPAPPPLEPAPSVPPPTMPAPAPTPPPPGVHFLDTLVASDTTALTETDFAQSAWRLGCEKAVIRAFFEVETGGRSGFAPDGKPLILYEPHIFSRRTSHRFDASNPSISYPTWDRNRYPGTQAGRWQQVREAYDLDAENALCAASWGAFQVMGFHHQRCGFPTAAAFVKDMCASMLRQLAAFEAYILFDPVLTQAVRDKNWRVMTERYNGAGQVDYYMPRLEAAYRRYAPATS
jgi:hypothetical protein